MAKKKQKDKSDEQADEPKDFEDALNRLESTVSKLEQGNVGLADALGSYEEGVKYLKYCHDLLQHAERKIEQLTGLDADGNPVTEPFEHEASASEKSRTAPKRRKKRSSKRTEPVGGEDVPTEDDLDESKRLF